MKIIVFSGYYLPGYKGGGPIKSLKNIFEKLSDNINFKLITSDRDLGDSTSYRDIDINHWNSIDNIDVFYSQPGLKYYLQVFEILKKKNYNLVYLNSFFSKKFTLAPLFITLLLKKEVLIAPRGELSSGALSIKPVKKKLFIRAIKTLGIDKRISFHASTKYEYDDIYSIFPKTPIYIAENISSKEFAVKLTTRSSSIIKGVFISRISPKKNLLFTLNTLKHISHPLIFHIYGPIEDKNYWKECNEIINDLPDHIIVSYKGELKPDEVILKISSYDFFFMPTKGENYGHVIVEALCAGLPLVIADTTPWRNLQEIGIGWDLPLDDINRFIDVIEKLANMSVEDHKKVKNSVLNWAKQRFNQTDAIEANNAMFKNACSNKKGTNNDV